MLKNIALTRPLAVIDIETTGTDPDTDRIVEISVLRIMPDGTRAHRTRRLNPGVPIPADAMAVHGITDADVADAPKFGQIADALLAFLSGCDFCGFNVKRFDLRLLFREFARVGRPLSLEGRAVVDAMEVFHRYEPRDLAAAVRFYLGREHSDAHSAAADVLATAEILDAMVARYPDLPATVPDMTRHLAGPDVVDLAGFFVRVGGELRFARGKHRGQPLATVAAHHPDYLEWMLGQGFMDDTKAAVREALRAAGPVEVAG
ncbi:MAG TPA: 3'-5' exonuclease [Gemmataceae bacterium]|jgi:DNA polymerase-3 subunit epsilon